MRRIRVGLKDRSYDILIGRGLLKSLGLFVKKLKLGQDAIVVTNARVFGLYGDAVKRSFKKSGITVRFEIVPGSEKAKSVGVMAGLLDRISRYDKTKKIFLVALGGGVIGDLTGFVAAIYKRGIPYVQVPTTLLGQVDSSIGGKTAIDLSSAKNLAGAIYQPKMVLSDIALLKSLPKRELQNGLAEVIKYGVIKDRELFSFLENNIEKILKQDPVALEYIVSRSSEIKKTIVEKDEFDKKDVRAILNFGHTLGHAIEAASKYSGRYTHGEAVAIGMLAASDIAMRSGVVQNISDMIRLRRLILSCGLPTKAVKVKPFDIWAAQLHDKKHSGLKNKFILPLAIGKIGIFQGITEKILKLSIAEMVANRS